MPSKLLRSRGDYGFTWKYDFVQIQFCTTGSNLKCASIEVANCSKCFKALLALDLPRDFS